jgi:sigma-B regulation protein RsbU (phosphoserine phosphatase)
VSLAAAILDPAAHAVTLINAGHMTPLVLRKAAWSLEDAIDNDAAGPPLGSVEGTVYGSGRVTLQPGDCLLLYTDGVTDAMNTQGKPFGLDGLRRAVLEESAVTSGPVRPEVVGHTVVDAVRRHSAGCAQNDDIAIVCFGRVDNSTDDLWPGNAGPATGRLVVE